MLVAIGGLASGFAQADEDELPAAVARILSAHGMSTFGFSAFVQDTAKSTPTLAVNDDVPRNPASTIKLLTTY
ncbi:MAG: D-alanyl-D-alanine carboxypeptidase/D-alanyl-D-alanine endopeptidase, partial [Gammaproteobacteria bacterium]